MMPRFGGSTHYVHAYRFYTQIGEPMTEERNRATPSAVIGGNL
jgi:hypothetical protein